MSVEVKLDGLDELVEDLKKAAKRYPDLAEEALISTGKKFKNRVIKLTYSAVDKKTGRLVKGYKLDPVEGHGANMHVNFRGTAPHYHLIENGHNQVTQKTRRKKRTQNGGRIIGFVPGRLIVYQAREEYKSELPRIMDETLSRLLKENNLL